MSLSILLIPYALFLLVAILWSMAMLYHLFRFGLYQTANLGIAALYLLGFLLILTISMGFLSGIPWLDPLEILSV